MRIALYGVLNLSWLLFGVPGPAAGYDADPAAPGRSQWPRPAPGSRGHAAVPRSAHRRSAHGPRRSGGHLLTDQGRGRSSASSPRMLPEL